MKPSLQAKYDKIIQSLEEIHNNIIRARSSCDCDVIIKNLNEAESMIEKLIRGECHAIQEN